MPGWLRMHRKVRQKSLDIKFTETRRERRHFYILFDKRLLNVGDKIDFDLFSTDENASHMRLYLQSDTVIDEETKSHLGEVEEIYVLEKERLKYEHFVEEHLQSVAKSDRLTLDEKTDIIYSAAVDLVHELYSNPGASHNVERSKKIVTPILQSIIYNQKTISSYIKIIEYDYYTYTHSLNVSIYAMSLGAELNMGEEELSELGQAALLHDLGKSRIDRQIVNKESRLTSEEYEQMRTHPEHGYDIALELGIGNRKILDGIRHHHEKLNGMGYPDRLQGEEITLFPRLIGVCDVFDALTTRRSYKSALESYDALYMMKKKMGHHLDLCYVNSFIKMLHE